MSMARRRGAIGALLDEYERAITDLKKVIQSIPDQALTIIFDPHTEDENCRSIQSILSHVVHSGFGYATHIENFKRKTSLARPPKTYHVTIAEYQDDLAALFDKTEQVFNLLEEQDLEQLDPALKIRTSWGQLYDIEQLTEHAMVHVLRHRRQIERIDPNAIGLLG
jgi:uncharacterized damage-inducible protein DinB